MPVQLPWKALQFLAALIVDSQNGDNVLCGTASHYAAVEKQYRYPTEYGVQKPETAQWSVTGYGVAIVSKQGNGKSTAATIGKVVDMGLKDPLNLGAAMAPAAVDTIEAHFKDLSVGPQDYDLIATGILVNLDASCHLNSFAKNIDMPDEKYVDCGLLLYHPKQPMLFSGGSGCGCSAVVTYGHILNRIKQGELKKFLLLQPGLYYHPCPFNRKKAFPV